MSRGMKLGIFLTVLVVGVTGLILAGRAKKRNAATEVRLEKVSRHDLVSAVTASGKIDPSQYEASVARAQGLVASAQASAVQAKASRDQAERAMGRAREMAKSGGTLISPEAGEQAHTSLAV